MLGKAEPNRRAHCRADLTDGHFERLASDHPIIDAQIFVNALFEEQEEGADNLSDLRAMCIALLHLWNRAALEDSALLDPGSLAGLEPESERVGTSPPADALFFGALVVSAKSLLMGTRDSDYAALRALVFNPARARRGRDDSWWKDGPSELIAAFGGSENTRRRMAHAIDSDLTFHQRIWYGSVCPPRSNLARSGHELPSNLWDEWVIALDPGGEYAIGTVRRTFDAALRLYADRQRQLARPESERGPLRPSDQTNDLNPKVLAAAKQTTGDLAGALGRLVDYATVNPPVLSYDMREQLIDFRRGDFLPRKHWDELVASIGGRVTTKIVYEQARAWMYERLTESYGPLVPRNSRRSDGINYFRPPSTTFVRGLSAQLLDAIDSYLACILRLAGSDAPIREVPLLGVLPAGIAPGYDVNDDMIHDVRRLAKVSTPEGFIAKSVNVPTRLVSLIIAMRPPSARSTHGQQRTGRPWRVTSASRVRSEI